MKQLEQRELSRLQFLLDVTNKAALHLSLTDERLFAAPMTIERINNLASNFSDGEQIDAFVSRFARLQDNLGAKLLPFYLNAVGERQATLLENLDKAERLGIIESADDWMTMRQLRNQMVHEYIDDAEILLSALRAGHEFVQQLLNCNENLHKLVNDYFKRLRQ